MATTSPPLRCLEASNQFCKLPRKAERLRSFRRGASVVRPVETRDRETALYRHKYKVLHPGDVMRFRPFRSYIYIFSPLLMLLLAGLPLHAQTSTGSVRGQVTDPSGAVVASATVMLISPT